MGKTYKKERIDTDRQSKSNKNHSTNKKKGKYKNEFFHTMVEEQHLNMEELESLHRDIFGDE